MESLMKELCGMGAFLPGTLEEYYSVCGKKGCSCADRKKPRKHGPYYRLSYDIRGRNSCLFVKKADVEKIRKMTGSYKRAKDIIGELAIANLEMVLKEGVCCAQESSPTVSEKAKGTVPSVNHESSGTERTKWHKRSMKYQVQLEKRRIEARDLRASRDKWRGESLLLRKKLTALEDRLESVEKEKFRIEVELKKKRG